MKRRPLILLAVAIGTGLASAQMARNLLRERSANDPARQPTTTQIAVAARDLPSGAILSEADLKMVSWPADAVPEAFLSSPQLAVGQGLRTPLFANEPLLSTRLAGQGVGGLPSVIPEGMRAVSVRVDDVIAVAGFVLPGTRVDVLVMLPAQEGRPSLTRSILQNVLVLAAGQSVKTEDQNQAVESSVITLLLDPNQAELLTLAANEGRIQLALRNTLDGSVVTTSGVQVGGLAGPVLPPARMDAPRAVSPSPASSVPAAARRVSSPPFGRGTTIEVYNGSTRTVENF